MHDLQRRIEYQGDLRPVLEQACKDYKIGAYAGHKIILIGYEDFNLILKTKKKEYFVKILGKFRDKQECERYAAIIQKVNNASISHPYLYNSTKDPFYENIFDGKTVRLFLMDYIKGRNLYELHHQLIQKEIKFIVKQAALINKIDLKSAFVYDSWAIINFLKEYKEKGNELNKFDKELILPLVKKLSKFNFKKLPHCFCHGDITQTNVVRSESGDLYIVDFAVANYYPRILELAVMLCEIFFDKDTPEKLEVTYNVVLQEYEKYIKLTSKEKQLLPFFIQLAHGMHLLRANYEKVVNRNFAEENEHFLSYGRVGLQYTLKLWKNSLE